LDKRSALQDHLRKSSDDRALGLRGAGLPPTVIAGAPELTAILGFFSDSKIVKIPHLHNKHAPEVFPIKCKKVQHLLGFSLV
jgi:hypothetical protein